MGPTHEGVGITALPGIATLQARAAELLIEFELDCNFVLIEKIIVSGISGKILKRQGSAC